LTLLQSLRFCNGRDSHLNLELRNKNNDNTNLDNLKTR
jgi:hypothetical protein